MLILFLSLWECWRNMGNNTRSGHDLFSVSTYKRWHEDRLNQWAFSIWDIWPITGKVSLSVFIPVTNKHQWVHSDCPRYQWKLPVEWLDLKLPGFLDPTCDLSVSRPLIGQRWQILFSQWLFVDLSAAPDIHMITARLARTKINTYMSIVH